MQLYMSGTPRNDVFQPIENRLCSYRLFSMYRDYAREVMKWLDAVRVGIVTVDDHLRRYPS